jgi:hypothetical protein
MSNPKTTLFRTVTYFLLTLAVCHSETVTLVDGQILEGKITRKTDSSIVILFDYGMSDIPMKRVKSIQDSTGVQTFGSNQSDENRFAPNWREIVERSIKQSWVSGYSQIPATVIDKGVLRYVPYVSFRINSDYELNIYGDPDNPMGVEIGVYRGLTSSEEAKANCLQFIASILKNTSSKAALDTLDRNKANSVVDGTLTLEITLPSSEDSYGGWWISAYNEAGLDTVRAKEEELKAISVASVAQAEPSNDPVAWSNSEIQQARPTPQTVVTSQTSEYSSNYSSSSSSGRVYVRGYYRKDGTYVQAHTRKRPSR